MTDSTILGNQFFRDYLPVYHDVGPALPNHVQTFVPNVPYTGRYITVYNNRTARVIPSEYYAVAFLELCEVEVYGKDSLSIPRVKC